MCLLYLRARVRNAQPTDTYQDVQEEMGDRAEQIAEAETETVAEAAGGA